MKRSILFITSLFCAFTGTSQNSLGAAQTSTSMAQTPGSAQQKCRCEESFEWLRSTFEANDAGFGYVVERKGRGAYDLHNSVTLNKVRATSNDPECLAALDGWLRFFRRSHIRLQLLNPAATTATSTVASTGQTAGQTAGQATEKNDQTAEWERWKGDIGAFEKEVAARENPGFEGVWEIKGLYTLGLVAEGKGAGAGNSESADDSNRGEKGEAESYIGFIISSTEPNWSPGQVRMKIAQRPDNNGETTWHTTYYTGARVAIESARPELTGDRVLHLETSQMLTRLSPAMPADADPAMERYVKLLTAEEPYFETLNPTTLYIRVPSFNSEFRAAINRLVIENAAALASTENLIIDVRGNGGGSDGSWSSLSALVYTGPVRTPGVAFRSTPHNIEQYSAAAQDPEVDAMTQMSFYAIAEKMKARPGEFVPWGDQEVRITTRPTVREFPRRVGIIIDRGCGSSTEQFLLEARQSLKVKTFGVTTVGALDASNLLSVDSPDGLFRLTYAASRSLRIPGMEIDDIGLQPDFYLDSSIPTEQWVEHVSGMLNR